jgi:hypothetical protein
MLRRQLQYCKPRAAVFVRQALLVDNMGLIHTVKSTNFWKPDRPPHSTKGHIEVAEGVLNESCMFSFARSYLEGYHSKGNLKHQRRKRGM